MVRKTKSATTINWNWIALLLTLLTLITFWVTTSNQNEVNLLKVQLEKSEREKNELNNEIDPNWITKYNEQKQYYKAEIQEKENIISDARNEIDSLIKAEQSNLIDLKNFKITKAQLERVTRKLIKADFDSAELVRQNQLVDLQQLQMDTRDSLINSLFRTDSLQRELIENLLARNKFQSEIIDTYRTNNVVFDFWDYSIILFLITLLAILLYLLYRNYRPKIN